MASRWRINKENLLNQCGDIVLHTEVGRSFNGRTIMRGCGRGADLSVYAVLNEDVENILAASVDNLIYRNFADHIVVGLETMTNRDHVAVLYTENEDHIWITSGTISGNVEKIENLFTLG